MKKTLIALAALASTAAFAQSVTLSGGVGMAAQKTTGGVSQLAQTDGWVNFAVTEDLGGGLSIAASQQIAANGRGGSVNAEDTKFSVAGGFGKVEFNQMNAGSNNLGSLASLEKDVNWVLGGDAKLSYLRYTAPTLVTGLTLQAGSYKNQTAAGAATATNLNTNIIGSSTLGSSFVKGTYTTGAATVAADYRLHDGRTRVWAGYDFGVAKIDMGTEVAYKDSTKKKQTGVGVTVPMGALTLGLHHETKDGTGKGTEVAAVYALSKRTNINFSYGNIVRTGADAGNGVGPFDGNSSRVRLLHTF